MKKIKAKKAFFFSKFINISRYTELKYRLNKGHNLCEFNLHI